MPFGPSHTVSIYRRGTTGGKRGSRVKTWALAISGVEANIQRLAGKVVAEAYGTKAEDRADIFLPAGTDVREGDGILVTAEVEADRTAPASWEVESVVPRGSRFRIEVEAVKSGEDFTDG